MSGTIPILPGWLADIIRKARGNDQAGPAPALDLPGDRERAFAAAALAKSIVEIEQAGRGTRNNTLNSLAYRLGRMVARGWIEEFAVVDGLSQACQSNGLVADDGLGSVRGTIESGLSAVLMRQLRQRADTRQIDVGALARERDATDWVPSSESRLWNKRGDHRNGTCREIVSS